MALRRRGPLERRRSVKASAHADVVANAIDDVDALLMRDDLTRQERLARAEHSAAAAIAAVFYALDPALSRLRLGPTERQIRVDALSWLHGVGVLPDILGPFAIDLYFEGLHNSSAGPDESLWQAIAAEAFDLLAELSTIKDAEALVEDDPSCPLPVKTLQGWRNAVRQRPISQHPMNLRLRLAGMEGKTKTKTLLQVISHAAVQRRLAKRKAKAGTKPSQKKHPL